MFCQNAQTCVHGASVTRQLSVCSQRSLQLKLLSTDRSYVALAAELL